MASFKPPNEFSPGSFPAEDWARWRQRFDLYFDAADIGSKPIAQQRAILLHSIGDVGLEIYNTLQIEEVGEERTVNVILNAFSGHYQPYKNTTYTRHLFFSATKTETESVDQFVTMLKAKARDCEFGEVSETLIRDRLICGIGEKVLQERLLREPNLTLNAAIDICRAEEVSKQQIKHLDIPKSETTVSAIVKKGQSQYKNPNRNMQKISKVQNQNKYPNATQQPSIEGQRACSRCNRKHVPRQCPAYGKVCFKCGRNNHFSSACTRKTIHTMTGATNDTEELFLGSLSMRENQDDWTENIIVKGQVIKFKIDTGAQVNIIPVDIFQKSLNSVELNPTSKVITGYTGHRVDILGTCTLLCQYKEFKVECVFYVTKVNSPAILGLHSSKQMGLVGKVATVDSVRPALTAEEIVNNYSDVFEGLGQLPGQHTIRVKSGAIPTVCPARKIPIGIQDRVKSELDRMEEKGIIAKVDMPTDWVHPIVVVPKASGEVRICMDPRELNEVIRREHYKLPTAEEIFSQLNGAKYFTVLDAKSAFWQIELDEPSSYLCTFSTPYGRYRFRRLPFGICSAPEVYQKAVHQILQGMDGSIAYFDDILIWGSTLEEHNANLEKTLRFARQSNLKLNKSKLQLAVKEIVFLGNKITENGLEVDPEKIKAIQGLQPPTEKKSLQRILGMFTYLSRFIPNLSHKTTYLRQLLRSDVTWEWDGQAQKSFMELKDSITTTPVLSHFNVQKGVTLSVDASRFGLGAVILQDSLPVAYSSASLNEVQQRYAQIEKELLAIVYGCEHFHYFVYGRPIIIQTDHKPLLGVVKKPLETLSPRLQRLVLRLQRYQYQLVHVPGKDLQIPDALSRDPCQDEFIDTDYLEQDIKQVNMLIDVSDKRLNQLKQDTEGDAELQKIKGYIEKGWPRKKNQIPSELNPYWDFKEELYCKDGLVMRGQKIVVPKVQQNKILQELHSAHQGIISCKNRARDCLFWIGINKQIEHTISSCSVCQASARANQSEPLMPHPVPQRPWQRLGTDFMTLKGEKYLIIIDYFSKYVECAPLSNMTAKSVIVNLKSIFSRHGIPNELISDNGPPFNSTEFGVWCKEWGIQHITSSPYHPRSNGMVERSIQTMKNTLKKTIEDGRDPYLAMLSLRSTPKQELPSPAEILMGRRIRTTLPCIESYLTPKFETKKIKDSLEQIQAQQKQRAESYTRPLEPLSCHQQVYMRQAMRQWTPARVTKIGPEPRTYTVTTQDGASYRRNRRHLRPAQRQMELVTSPVPARERGSLVTDSIPRTQTRPPGQSPSSKVVSRYGRPIKPPVRFQY